MTLNHENMHETTAGSPGTHVEAQAGSDLERDAAELHAALSELVRVYQFRDRKSICCHDVSVTQCYALEAMIRRESLTLNDLAAELYLDKSTTSRVVDSLERKGYTTRLRDPDDGRVVRLEATEGGRALHARIERDLLEEKRQLLADIDPDVRQATARLIARLARTATERFGQGGEACCSTEE